MKKPDAATVLGWVAMGAGAVVSVLTSVATKKQTEAKIAEEVAQAMSSDKK